MFSLARSTGESLCLSQDVVRTNPSLLVRDDHKDVMSSILFIYAKKHPEIAYKQGMHEILAIVIGILHSKTFLILSSRPPDNRMNDFFTTASHRAFSRVHTPSAFDQDSARGPVLSVVQRHLVQTVNDGDFLEHDAYAIFEKTMERMWDWYHVPSCAAVEDVASRRPASRGAKEEERMPFASREEEEEDHDKNLSKAAKALHKLWHNTLSDRDKVKETIRISFSD